MGGLRDLKKERTRQMISDTAIAMFLADGFDQVAVADIAAAAEVSKPTLFRYFATKEDLVLHRFADHNGEAARVVRARQPGERPLAALHRHFQEGLDRRDPVTGLDDSPEVLAFHNLVFTTQSVVSRLVELETNEVEALAEALREVTPGELVPRLVAVQFTAVRQALSRENWRRLAADQTAESLYPQASADATDAFALLSQGAAAHGY
jgi:AcrR family transcriptional regulator